MKTSYLALNEILSLLAISAILKMLTVNIISYTERKIISVMEIEVAIWATYRSPNRKSESPLFLSLSCTGRVFVKLHTLCIS